MRRVAAAAAGSPGACRPVVKVDAMLMDEDGAMLGGKWQAYVETSVMSSALSPFEVSVATQRFADAAEGIGAMLMDEDGALIGWKTYAEIRMTGTSCGFLEHMEARRLAFLAGAFHDFDFDGDGFLDKAELRTALVGLGLPADDIDVQALFLHLDRNNDDRIHLNEWLDRVPPELQEKLQDHAGAASWRRHALP